GMAALAVFVQVALVVCQGPQLGPRPLGQNREETRDVRGDLANLFASEIATEAWLPDLAGAPDQLIFQIIVCRARWFHRRPHGRLRAVPCLWPPVLGIPPTTPDLSEFTSGVPVAGIAGIEPHQ